VSTPTIREYIMNPEKITMLHSVVAEGLTEYGMQTFDQSVLQLLREGLITEQEALKNCNKPNELLLKLKGIEAASDRSWQSIETARDAAPALGLVAPSTGGSSGGLDREPTRPPRTGDAGARGGQKNDWAA
jgi:twitching motility protein PilT